MSSITPGPMGPATPTPPPGLGFNSAYAGPPATTTTLPAPTAPIDASFSWPQHGSSAMSSNFPTHHFSPCHEQSFEQQPQWYTAFDPQTNVAASAPAPDSTYESQWMPHAEWQQPPFQQPWQQHPSMMPSPVPWPGTDAAVAEIHRLRAALNDSDQRHRLLAAETERRLLTP